MHERVAEAIGVTLGYAADCSAVHSVPASSGDAALILDLDM